MSAQPTLPDRTRRVAESIDAFRELPDAAAQLVKLLHEESPIYAGRRTTEVEQLRAQILASFEQLGLPDDALPFVLEELESGNDPSTVAAAGRALRGAPALPSEAFELVVATISRLRGSDDSLTFNRPALRAENGGTMLADLAETLAMLAPRSPIALASLTMLMKRDGAELPDVARATIAATIDALGTSRSRPRESCCGGHDDLTPLPAAAAAHPVAASQVELENQDGERLTFAEAFTGTPTALAFFYTRCMNPDKCSLTVTRLGRLAKLIEAEGLAANVAGISYDPRFDHPQRLKRYGTDRAIRFSPNCALMRTTGSLDPLSAAFQLSVGFGPVTVNRHAVELFVIDASLRISAKFERRLWDERTVLDALRVAAHQRSTSR